MRANLLSLTSLMLIAFSIWSCTRKTEDYPVISQSDYLPLQSGKYIIYRLDSTVFTNFNQTTEVHSYQQKDVVDSLFMDNLGRPSYRIFRFLRDVDGTQPWSSAGTYYITPTSTTTEVIEENMRTIRLIYPVKLNETWHGNHYLPTGYYQERFNLGTDYGISDWNYTYTNIGDTMHINSQVISDVLTVDIVDESTDTPNNDPNSFYSTVYAQDRYAKGIGLVSQDLIMWEHQPTSTSTGGGSKYGFGVKRRMINHN